MKKLLIAAAMLTIGLGASAQSQNGRYYQDGENWYYMIEDFEGYEEGRTFEYVNQGGTGTVATDHPMQGAKALKVAVSDYKETGALKLDVTLPAGITLNEGTFTNIQFDVYFASGDVEYKKDGSEWGDMGMHVWLTSTDNNNLIYHYDTEGVLGQTIHMTAPLVGHYTENNTFTLYIGGLSSKGDAVYYLDNVRLECAPGYTPSQPSSGPDEYPNNNLLSEDQWGFENGEVNGWFSWNNNPSLSVESGYESDHCLMATVSGEGGNEWGAQAMLQLDSAPEVGGVYTVSFRAKAEKTANISFVMSRHEAPHLLDGISINPISLTTEWKQYTGDVTITHEGEDRLTFNVGNVATDYYIDNVSVVLKSAPVHATGVSLDKANAEVSVDGNITLVATVTPAEASIKDVTWESSDEEVASVDENGVVIGRKLGTATITATTVDGKFKASCEVTVVEVVLDWANVVNNNGIEYAYDNASNTLYFRPTGDPVAFTNDFEYNFKNTYKAKPNLTVEFLEGITGISMRLFHWDWQNIIEVKFPESLTSIASSAFQRCTGITEIDLSKTNVTSIGESAFETCSSVESVKLPATLQTIAINAFRLGRNAAFEFHSIPSNFGSGINSSTCAIILNDAEHPFISNTAPTNMPTIASAEYKRNVTAAYSTICLPFEVSELGGVKVYEMTGNASPSIVTLTEAASIEAGKPYVVAAANIDFTAAAPAITVATTPAEAGSMKLIGVMQKTVVDASENAYGLSGGKLYHNTGNMTINPMRAYFLTTSPAPAREMSFSFGEATAISNVAVAESDIVAVYGANGTRQARLTKGVNLVKTANGNIMKVIVK